MTLEEKRTKMAVSRLDWEPHESWRLIGTVKHSYRWRHFKTQRYCYDLPDLPNDERTRKDILAVMTFSEKADLCNRLVTGEEDGSEDFLVRVLELTQPDFFELAGQAMNLWK